MTVRQLMWRVLAGYMIMALGFLGIVLWVQNNTRGYARALHAESIHAEFVSCEARAEGRATFRDTLTFIFAQTPQTPANREFETRILARLPSVVCVQKP